jgi:hypothetical protein
MDTWYSTFLLFAGYGSYHPTVENMECCKLMAMSLLEDCHLYQQTAFPLVVSSLQEGSCSVTSCWKNTKALSFMSIWNNSAESFQQQSSMCKWMTHNNRVDRTFPLLSLASLSSYRWIFQKHLYTSLLCKIPRLTLCFQEI